VNADAKLDPPLRRPPGIALDHAVLTSIAQRTQSTFRRSGERLDSVQCAGRGGAWGARSFVCVTHGWPHTVLKAGLGRSSIKLNGP
jgi:hypothetical protein